MRGSASLQWDRAGNGTEREKEVDTFRWACPKFLRQSFHEWAGHSIAHSQWARSYYQQQRSEARRTMQPCEVCLQMDSHRFPLLERSGGL